MSCTISAKMSFDDSVIYINLIEEMLVKKHYNEVKNLIKQYMNDGCNIDMLNTSLKNKMAPADIRKMVGGDGENVKTNSHRLSRRN